eukprot:s341_g30.t2
MPASAVPPHALPGVIVRRFAFLVAFLWLVSAVTHCLRWTGSAIIEGAELEELSTGVRLATAWPPPAQLFEVDALHCDGSTLQGCPDYAMSVRPRQRSLGTSLWPSSGTSATRASRISIGANGTLCHAIEDGDWHTRGSWKREITYPCVDWAGGSTEAARASPGPGSWLPGVLVPLWAGRRRARAAVARGARSAACPDCRRTSQMQVGAIQVCDLTEGKRSERAKTFAITVFRQTAAERLGIRVEPVRGKGYEAAVRVHRIFPGGLIDKWNQMATANGLPDWFAQNRFGFFTGELRNGVAELEEADAFAQNDTVFGNAVWCPTTGSCSVLVKTGNPTHVQHVQERDLAEFDVFKLDSGAESQKAAPESSDHSAGQPAQVRLPASWRRLAVHQPAGNATGRDCLHIVGWDGLEVFFASVRHGDVRAKPRFVLRPARMCQSSLTRWPKVSALLGRHCALQFAPDGSLLLVLHGNGFLDAWRPMSGEMLGRWHLQGPSAAYAASFCVQAPSRRIIVAWQMPRTAPRLEALPLPHRVDCQRARGEPLHFDVEGTTLTLLPGDYSRQATPWRKRTQSDLRESSDELKDEPSSPPAEKATAPSANSTRPTCQPTIMPLELPEPLGPKLFIWGEPVLRKYYTVYDWQDQQIGFALAKHMPSEVSADEEAKQLRGRGLLFA